MTGCMAAPSVQLSPEERYVQVTGLAHRRRFGQFFTPDTVAAFMAQWVCAHRPETVLDPAYGLGVFHRHVVHQSGARAPRYVAYEKDAHVLAHAATHIDANNLCLRTGDYLKSDFTPFDAVICNPPYLQFQKFPDRHDVLAALEAATGARLGGCSNMAAAFLFKALHQLAPGGRLAFLSPMEFFNTRYAQVLREKLVCDGLLKHVVIIPDASGIFPEAVTSVAVLLCCRDGVRADVTCHSVKSLRELPASGARALPASHAVPLAGLEQAQKWTPLLEGTRAQTATPAGFVPAGQYGRFLRGIATGANQFFMGSAARFEALGIPSGQLQPCVSRSSQVGGVVFTDQDHARLARAERPVWYLHVQEPLSAPLQDYLYAGEKQNFHQRFLTRNRSPWYRPECREPAPLWVGAFFRGSMKVVRNFSTARTLTCFHSFYPNPGAEEILDALYVYLLSAPGQAQMAAQGSRYAAGLQKVEPGDLNRTLCPPSELLRKLDRGVIRAVHEAASIAPEQARSVATAAIESLGSVGE